MIDPKVYASAVLQAEVWWQQFFNGNAKPLAEALEPVSQLTPELAKLCALVSNPGNYSEVKSHRVKAHASLEL